MPGPAPKHPSTRARQNRSATTATLRPRKGKAKVPQLPSLADGERWHPMTLAWWRDVWGSPMAPEYDDSDKHGLFALAMLVNDFWSATSTTLRRNLAAEIRQQGQRFGLSPIDRRRLQWEIVRTDEAQSRTKARKPARSSSGGSDPRSALRAV